MEGKRDLTIVMGDLYIWQWREKPSLFQTLPSTFRFVKSNTAKEN